MEFIIQQNKNNEQFTLVYDTDEYSFRPEPFSEYAYSSILINFLELTIDFEGTLLGVIGYCPLIHYKEVREYPKSFSSNAVKACFDKELIPGISLELNRNWPVFLNKEHHWVCLGDPSTVDMRMVEFAPNCVATLKDKELIAIWLHPIVVGSNSSDIFNNPS